MSYEGAERIMVAHHTLATDELIRVKLDRAAALVREALALAESQSYGQITIEMREAEKQLAYLVRELA